MARAGRPASPRASLVAVGASAGGLESIGDVLEGLPAGFQAPIVVVLHLDPTHRSAAADLLQRRTALKVLLARHGARPRRGHVYVAPPDRHLEVRSGQLHVRRGPHVNHSRPSVDVLFQSVAAAHGAAGIGVVLSGTGHDGALGLAAIKAAGGLAVVEDSGTAGFPGMPEAAARATVVDAALPARQVAAFLLRAVRKRVRVAADQWRRMLALLEARRGTRFARYRSSTLQRRLQHRLAATGSPTMASYLRRLAADPVELDALHAAFLIKVSSFLRDPQSWKALDREVARLAAARGPRLRAWSAGCATGEEAYTLALALARRLGTAPGAAWKVYGTDLDDQALKAARAGRYGRDQLALVPKAELRRHFQRDGDGWRVRKALRGHVVFGRHDLLHDPPLPDLDVLACRNVLIYFRPEERERALARLGAAVRPGGLLFLGQSEGSRAVAGFTRVGRTTLFRKAALATAMRPRQAAKPDGRRARGDALADTLADSETVVAFATDAKGRVRLWNRAAEAFFGCAPARALGRPLASVLGAAAARELRPAGDGGEAPSIVWLEAEGSEGQRTRRFEAMPASPPLRTLYLGTEAPDGAAARRGAAGHVTAADARPRHRTARARMAAQQELNEELQSRNEELETVNEELQSLNNELTAMEEQMRGMAEESRRSSEFLRLLLDSSPDALVACDAENRVAFWGRSAVRRFRLSSLQAVGGDLFALVPALATPALRAAARKARQPGRGGRVSVLQDDGTYTFEPLPGARGARRGYLLRVRSAR